MTDSHGTLRSGRWHALACALLLAILILLSRPFAEIGLNDDWSYAYTANVLAKTGHIAYNGWAAMPLTWVLYWGALFIKLFGFSFFTLRVSALLVAMATVFGSHRVLQRCGLSVRASTLGTLALMLTPYFFSSVFVYMSDMPGMLGLLCCFYAVLRACQSVSDRSALMWLIAAAVSNTLVGSVRQISWLGVLVIVPCAVWLLRQRKHVVPVMAGVYVACGLFILGLMRWFAHQDYSVSESLVGVHPRPFMIGLALKALLTTLLFLSPLLVAFVAALRWRSGKVSGTMAAGMAALLWISMHLRYANVFDRTTWTFPFTDNSLGQRGFYAMWVLPGTQPTVLTAAARIFLTWLPYALALAIAVFAATARRRSQQPSHTRTTRDLWILFGPFAAAYLVLYLTRPISFDRYLMPLCLLLVMALLRWLKSATARQPSWLLLAPMLLLAAFDVAATHDIFAMYRARVQAADELLAAGIPRTHFSAGYEYDGWTEIETTGYVKHWHARLKRGDQAFIPDITVKKPCAWWFEGSTPSVQPEYYVQFTPRSCTQPTALPDVQYHTWLTGEQTLTIGKLAQ